MKKDIKLYNVMFPIWLIILMPPIILLVIPANFIVDSLGLIIGFKVLHTIDNFQKYKKSILKVWGFGFLVDILGSLLLFVPQFLWFSDFISNNLIEPLMWNPFSNPLALIYALIIVAICGYLIYLINYHFSFKKTDLSDKEIKVISILLGVITAPYLFLLPTSLFY